MKKFKYFAVILICGLFHGCGSSEGPTDMNDDDQEMDDPPIDTPLKTEAFAIDNLIDEMNNNGDSIMVYLDKNTMTSMIYHLDLDHVDQRNVSPLDEVYYVYEGSAKLIIEGTEEVVEDGYTIFIPANQSRIFTEITEPLTMVITGLKQRTANGPHKIFSDQFVKTGRNPNSNVWNPFLNERSVIFGLYMLPRTVNGDGRLVHAWDELNIISTGNCTFQTDDLQVGISRGSIVYVEQGNGHFFRGLVSNTDIFILWNQ